jgi:hypothetical protein
VATHTGAEHRNLYRKNHTNVVAGAEHRNIFLATHGNKMKMKYIEIIGTSA